MDAPLPGVVPVVPTIVPGRDDWLRLDGRRHLAR